MIHMQPFDQAWTLLKQTSSEAARYYFQNKNMNMAHNLSPNFNNLPPDSVAALLSQMENSNAGTLTERQPVPKTNYGQYTSAGGKTYGFEGGNMTMFGDKKINVPLPSADPSQNEFIRRQFPLYARQQTDLDEGEREMLSQIDG